MLGFCDSVNTARWAPLPTGRTTLPGGTPLFCGDLYPRVGHHSQWATLTMYGTPVPGGTPLSCEHHYPWVGHCCPVGTCTHRWDATAWWDTTVLWTLLLRGGMPLPGRTPLSCGHPYPQVGCHCPVDTTTHRWVTATLQVGHPLCSTVGSLKFALWPLWFSSPLCQRPLLPFSPFQLDLLTWQHSWGYLDIAQAEGALMWGSGWSMWWAPWGGGSCHQQLPCCAVPLLCALTDPPRCSSASLTDEAISMDTSALQLNPGLLLLHCLQLHTLLAPHQLRVRLRRLQGLLQNPAVSRTRAADLCGSCSA